MICDKVIEFVFAETVKGIDSIRMWIKLFSIAILRVCPWHVRNYSEADKLAG